MGIFDFKYGRFGKISRSEWKALLNSNKGLFRRLPRGRGVIGPKLTREGEWQEI